MQKQDQRPALRFKASLQHVHVKAIDAPHEAGADAGDENGVVQRCHLVTTRSSAAAPRSRLQPTALSCVSFRGPSPDSPLPASGTARRLSNWFEHDRGYATNHSTASRKPARSQTPYQQDRERGGGVRSPLSASPPQSALEQANGVAAAICGLGFVRPSRFDARRAPVFETGPRIPNPHVGSPGNGDRLRRCGTAARRQQHQNVIPSDEPDSKASARRSRRKRRPPGRALVCAARFLPRPKLYCRSTRRQ